MLGTSRNQQQQIDDADVETPDKLWDELQDGTDVRPGLRGGAPARKKKSIREGRARGDSERESEASGEDGSEFRPLRDLRSANQAHDARGAIEGQARRSSFERGAGAGREGADARRAFK